VIENPQAARLGRSIYEDRHRAHSGQEHLWAEDRGAAVPRCCVSPGSSAEQLGDPLLR